MALTLLFFGYNILNGRFGKTPNETSTWLPNPNQIINGNAHSLKISPVMSVFNNPTKESPKPPIEECLEVMPELTESENLPGSILFGDSWTDQIHIVNLETREQDVIQNVGYFFSGQSPDGRWIAAQDRQLSKVVLFTAKGEKYEVASWHENWRNLSSWVNNDILLIELTYETTNNKSDEFPVGLLSVSTGEYEEIDRSYPEFNPEYEFAYFKSGRTFYSSNFSRVAYPANSTGSQEFLINLFNLQSNQIIARIPLDDGVIVSPPKWSPDGSLLLLKTKKDLIYDKHTMVFDELIAVSKDGVIRQLTRFSELYNESVNLGGYQWSPDGQFVAFWVWPARSYQYSIHILNTDTLDITNYCVTSEASYGQVYDPIWSPDSSAFLIERVQYADEYDPETAIFEVVLIDIKNNFAVKVIEGVNISPLGWLINNHTEQP